MAFSERLKEEEREILPYVVEFVKFSTSFAVIVAVALIALHGASSVATMG